MTTGHVGPARRAGIGPTKHRYRLYGLVVHSTFDLHQRRSAGADELPDVRVDLGPVVPDVLPEPSGTVLAGVRRPDGRGYSIVVGDDGNHLMRFHGACDIAISADLSEVEVRPAAGAPPGLPQVLTVGAMLAFQLYLRGHLVLHASAVENGGTSIAFAGRSGMGKSTLAAVMCADGGRLITDDVLRVDDWSSVPRARLGATELRIRRSAEAVVERFPSAPSLRASADGRSVLQLADDAEDCSPLAAIVIPSLSRDSRRLSVERLPRKSALLALLGFPRLAGWRQASVLATQFDASYALVGAVPVLIAHVPWGLPSEPGLAQDLMTAIAGEALQAA